MVRKISEAETIVMNVFIDEFPDDNFRAWDSELSDTTSTNIIKAVGRAMTINVKCFIQDLWNAR